MFIKKRHIYIVLVAISFSLNAQNYSSSFGHLSRDIFSTLQDETYGGDINIYQSPSINVLIDKNKKINKKNGVRGYRIQIFSASGISARTEANEVRREFIDNFPEIDSTTIYFDYQAPYFKVVVGNFRNKNEAFKEYHQIHSKFDGAYIIKSKIEYPKLD
jgi:hypothetical protein